MALPVSWWLESHLDIWNPSPFQWLSCDWPELFKDCIPSFPGSAEPSNSHCTENIPDSRENRTEGSHRHNLKEETMTHQAQRRALCRRHATHTFLLPVCASYDFGEKKPQNIICWWRVGKEKNLFCLGFGQFLPMRWGLQLCFKAIICPCYVITQRNYPFWEKVSELGNCTSQHLGIHRWCQVRKGSEM